MPLTSTFSTIAASQTQADKPLDTILLDAMRQDIDVLYEWMGGPTYTPSTSHNHNGTNSKNVDGASLSLLASATALGSATVDFISGLTTSYNGYMFVGMGIRPDTGGGVALRAQTRPAGSTVFDSGASDYRGVIRTWESDTNFAWGSGDQAFIQISLAEVSTASNHGLSFLGYLFLPSSTTLEKRLFGDTAHTDVSATPTEVRAVFSARRLANTAVDGIRFYMSSGNIAAGQFFLYGIKHT